MLDLRSALAGFDGPAEQSGADGAIGLEIGEVTGWSLVEIGVYPSKQAEGERAIESWLGTIPERIATPTASANGLLIRTGPLSFWLVNSTREATAGRTYEAARAALPEAVTSVIDLTSSRTRLFIDGTHAADVLLKGIPIDLAIESFPMGAIALTGVHHTPILLFRTAPDRFEIFAMRTFALTVLDWLTDAALEFGYRLRNVHP
ncbi:MAG: sarcosine oxidase subunit gamma family protein [Hyphomicrobiaceae bacterium]